MEIITGDGNVMYVGVYQKSVCKEYRTEGVYCRYNRNKNLGIWLNFENKLLVIQV